MFPRKPILATKTAEAQQPPTVETLFNSLRDVIARFNGFISLGTGGNGEWAGNMDGQWLHVAAPATPDTEFPVAHGLGRVPAGYVVRADAACSVYDSRPASWGTTQVFLKCNVASVNLRIMLF